MRPGRRQIRNRGPSGNWDSLKEGKSNTLGKDAMTRIYRYLRIAIGRAIEHDVVNTAKATAYSGMLMLFPALLVVAALLARVDDGPTLVGEVRGVFAQFLPADTMDMLQSYLLSRRIHSLQLVCSAASLSLFAGLGVMLSLMEGFRRAYQLPPGGWGFWRQRLRALLLVPIALVPLAIATLFIVFGHQIELWMVRNTGHGVHLIVVFFWRMIRWLVSLATSAAVLSVLYHFGTRRREHWTLVAPGAMASTAIWFPTTLAFGWYVTRIADYSMFYGSFGAGIATLVWLYITSFSALLGAEINGVLYSRRHNSL
jgi:membrane protein